MSWSAYWGNVAADRLPEDLEPERAVMSPALESLADGPREQLDAARRAALVILTSGAVGGPERRFSVGMSGHANPGHEPAEGWSRDQVEIRIRQRES